MKKDEMIVKDKKPQIGKAATQMLGRAKDKIVSVMDQNDDGTLDFKDATQLAGRVSEATKNKAASIKSNMEERAKMLERKNFLPIFDEDIDSADFALSKLVRLCEIDKKRADSVVCQGAIGHFTESKDLRMVNMYRNSLDKFNLSFYPDDTYEFYFVDPNDRDRYIALEDYFGYLKVERINELQKIAQDLGAKYFKVTYKEEQSEYKDRAVSANVNAKKNVDSGSAEASFDRKENSFSNIEIAAEMHCPGHAPKMPQLNYLKRDTSVQNLISMRMDEMAPITHHKFTLKLSNTSGIKESDAVKIDAMLKGVKASTKASMVNEVKEESRRFLEYEIDF